VAPRTFSAPSWRRLPALADTLIKR